MNEGTFSSLDDL